MRAIVTVVGRDQVGIIAAVCALLCEKNVNVLDISQTILQEYFTMIMLVDLTEATVSFSELREQIGLLGQKYGVVTATSSGRILSTRCIESRRGHFCGNALPLTRRASKGGQPPLGNPCPTGWTRVFDPVMRKTRSVKPFQLRHISLIYNAQESPPCSTTVIF